MFSEQPTLDYKLWTLLQINTAINLKKQPPKIQNRTKFYVFWRGGNFLPVLLINNFNNLIKYTFCIIFMGYKTKKLLKLSYLYAILYLPHTES